MEVVEAVQEAVVAGRAATDTMAAMEAMPSPKALMCRNLPLEGTSETVVWAAQGILLETMEMEEWAA
jgi:hypothetical protein